MRLTGEVRKWWVPGGPIRQYSLCTMTLDEVLRFAKPEVYNGLKHTGQQRVSQSSHARNIQKAMVNGDFTPTPISLSLTKDHRKKIEQGNSMFTLELDEELPLILNDGGHRISGLKNILDKLEGGERYELLSLDLPVMLYLDGDPQQDFVNLQKGKSVDSSHLLSLNVQQRNLDALWELAFATAKALHRHKESPFYRQIKFDSMGGTLPLHTLCAKSSGDQACSLFGLAKVARHFIKDIDAEVVAFYVISTWKSLCEKAPDLLERGKILCQPDNGGTKGAATLLLGISLCLTYSVLDAHVSSPDANLIPPQNLLDRMVGSAAFILDKEVEKSFSAPLKRQYIHEFAMDFFGGNEGAKYEGIPQDLLDILSYSAFGLQKS